MRWLTTQSVFHLARIQTTRKAAAAGEPADHQRIAIRLVLILEHIESSQAIAEVPN